MICWMNRTLSLRCRGESRTLSLQGTGGCGGSSRRRSWPSSSTNWKTCLQARFHESSSNDISLSLLLWFAARGCLLLRHCGAISTLLTCSFLNWSHSLVQADDSIYSLLLGRNCRI